MSRTPHVLFFLEGTFVPASRMRVAQYLSHVAPHEFTFRCLTTSPSKYLTDAPGSAPLYTTESSPFSKLCRAAPALFKIICIRIAQILWYVPRADVVFLQRDLLYRIPIPFLEWLIFFIGALRRCLGLPFRAIIDVDDLIFSTPDATKAPTTLSWKLTQITQVMDVVIVGNSYLGSFFPPDKTVTIPTTIAPPLHPIESTVHSPPIVGWSGLASNLPYLVALEPALMQLHCCTPFVLRILCEAGTSNPFPHAPFQVEMRAWSESNEQEEISQFSVGIMPLPDTPWARGKCGFKALQYMALGVPAVISPIGANKEILVHGRSGFFATSQQEWCDALYRLLYSSPLRERIGKGGRTQIDEHFSVERWVTQWKLTITGTQASDGN